MNLLATIPEAVWPAIITAVVTVVLAYMQYRIEMIKTALKENSVVLDKVHILTNNSMGLALTSIAELARWKAQQPGATKRDVEAADKAEAALAEHMRKQAVVDGAE